MKYCRFCTFFLVIVMILAHYGCISGKGTGEVEILIEEKDYHGAIEVAEAIVASKPGTPIARQAQLAIGKLYIETMNQPEKGVEVYQEIISAAPDSDEAASANYRLGVHYLKSKEFESARGLFDTIINKFPEHELSSNAQLLLAKSYEEAQNYEQAAEIYGNFANRYPKSDRAAQALVRKGQIQKEQLKDKSEAKRTYQSLVKKYGKVEGTETSISEAKRELQLMGATIPKPEDPLASQAGRSLARREKRRALDRPQDVERSRAMGAAPEADSGFGVSGEQIMRTFQFTMDGQGTYYDAMLMVGNMLFQEEGYRDAGALYFRAIQLAKQAEAEISPYSYLSLSICYRKLGMHQRAQEVLNKAVRSNREVLEAIIKTGENQYANDDYEKAIETYQFVVGFNPFRDSEIYWRIGLAYKKMGDPHQAMESFERAVAAKTDSTDALQSLAEVLYYQLNKRRRAEIFQDLVDAKGNTYHGEKELGDVCYKYGNYTRAKTKYEAAARIAERQKQNTTSQAEQHKLDGYIIDAKVHAAMAAHKDGMADRAKEGIDALASEYPEHALIAYGRGQLALLEGDADVAVAAFKESIEKDPHSDVASIALGEYYVSQGYADEALALWEEFLEHHRYNQEVRRRLNELKTKIKSTETSNQKSE